MGCVPWNNKQSRGPVPLMSGRGPVCPVGTRSPVSQGHGVESVGTPPQLQAAHWQEGTSMSDYYYYYYSLYFSIVINLQLSNGETTEGILFFRGSCLYVSTLHPWLLSLKPTIWEINQLD